MYTSILAKNPPIEKLDALWQEVLPHLEMRLTKAVFDDLGLARSRLTSTQDSKFIVNVDAPGAIERLKFRASVIEDAVSAFIGVPIEMIFQLSLPVIASLEDAPCTEKTVSLEVSGFTPFFDGLAAELNNVHYALVFGVVWRYCQMDKRFCRVKKAQLAERLSISEKTVERGLRKLCDEGYLKDLTPDIVNAPHVYKETGKIEIRLRLWSETGD